MRSDRIFRSCPWRELNERIALMKSEIARLEADIDSKQSSRSAADQFFKK